MSQDIQTLEGNDLSVSRNPQQILVEAEQAATALKGLITQKIKLPRVNGKELLTFECWQTLGKFYGITAKVTETTPVEFDGVRGFQAKAVALHVASGVEISAAESMCLNDEQNWGNKPLFQLRSMAQTRACAKALRNVLAWVVVLAGYEPTPAEEMDAQTDKTDHTEPAPPPAVRKSTNGNGTANVRDRLWEVCLKAVGGEVASAHDFLEGATSFTDKETGKVVKGKRNVADLSEKWAQSTLNRLTANKG